jgi:hypothetical protein
MTDAVQRPTLVRRGLWLNYLTIGYNTIEALVSLAAGVVAGSVALISVIALAGVALNTIFG